MADSKAKKDAGGDFGAGEVTQAFEQAQDQGFFGSKVDPLPNSDHSLESGPDAPPVNQAESVAAATPKEG